ncbi:MAG TPA: Stk1 family PASTA domain-containing Ser/Thr kinase [Firmicutes bacterium]|jgi:serine/threonine-protein kinase|nr:Stk1 family PASTA domain-containing Ser/Thr kinase [Bacillota bacterium]
MIGEKLVNRYEILEKVGDGGMALVYRAKDTLLNRIVAVKVLRDQFSTDMEFVERFRREAQSAASLSHPNVVNIYDVGQTDTAHFIVMEYVQGENLSAVIREKGALSEHFVVSVSLQIARALSHAHQHGIVHRDIKPHNILITQEGQVKVTDFGIAQAMSAANLTQTGVVLGSVHYFSPEQARGVNVTSSSDLYSLGVVMYEMLTGRQPFRGDTPIAIALKQIQENPVPLRQHLPELNRSLEQLVMRLMAKEPSQRPQDADEVARALQRIERELDADSLQEHTVVLEAIDAPDKEVDEVAGKKGKGRRRKKAKPRRGGTIILVLALLIGFGWGMMKIVPMILFGEDVQVPAIVGLSTAEAERLLQAAGLLLSVEQEVYDNNIPAGHIVTQEPVAGRMVKQGRPIEVRISMGRQILEVPDVSGMTPREARLALTQAGFVLGEEREVFDPESPVNAVVEQHPEPGITVEMGTPVDLVINRGQEVLPYVVVPDFRGQMLRDVQGSLAAHGLTVGNLWQEYSTEYSEGQVIEQNPSPGERVEVGWPIDFVYSQGAPRQPVRVPSTPQAESQQQPPQDQWTSLRVQITVPEGPPQEVTILVIDDFGAREVYRETHPGGERVERIIQGRGDGAVLQVYIGGRMFENRLFKE